jgi:hypothetical protein
VPLSFDTRTNAGVTGIWTGVGTSAKGDKVDTSERWTDTFVRGSASPRSRPR